MIGKQAVIFAVFCLSLFSQRSHAILYGVSDGNPGSLYRIDEASGLATLIAPITPGNVSLTGASFLNGTLYATDIFGQSNIMGTIDITTGSFTASISQGFSINIHGLASDEAAGLLYTIDQDDNNTLKSITASGVFTTIGSGTGIDGRGMAFDGLNDILYAASGDNSLYIVDTTMGTAQLVGPLGISANRIGLAYDEDTQTLYANEGDVTFSLYTVNVSTGAASLVGANLATDINGLAWVAVPELTTFALIAVGMVTSLGFRSRPRRW
jgi:DNA-binding beta-propeller fold protein YncE